MLKWVLLILVIAGGAAYYFFGMPKGPAEVPHAVKRGNIRRTSHGIGVIEGNSVVTRLKCPFAAPVDSVEFKENDLIKQHDVVASLNPAELLNKIELEKFTLEENTAKRDAIKSRTAAESIEGKRTEIKRAHEEVIEAETRLAKLQAPASALERQERMEDARLNLERARRALAVAEGEQRQLLAHPTPLELEAALARLELAKLRNDDAKRTGQNKEGAAAELRSALADYEKIRPGAGAEERALAAARVAQAQTELTRAEAENQRFQSPQPPAPAPAADIDAAKKTLAAAQAREAEKQRELDALRTNADSAETRAAEAAIKRSQQTLKMYETMKEGYNLRAPFDALVVKRLVEPGVLLMPNEDVMWIVNFSKKRVRAEFDIASLASLSKTGLTAVIKSRAFGKEELTARVIKLGRFGPRLQMQDDPSQPKGGEIVEVVLEVNPPKDDKDPKKALYDLLRPGMRVETDILLEQRPGVINVPKSYVASESSESGDVQFVWKVDGPDRKHMQKREVKCGLRDEYYVEILEGLSENDLIVKPQAFK